jgi:hypothetical protein
MTRGVSRKAELAGLTSSENVSTDVGRDTFEITVLSLRASHLGQESSNCNCPEIDIQGATRPTGALSPLLPVACSRSVLLAKCSVVLEGVAQVSLKVHRWVEGHLHGTCCLTDGLLVMAYTNVAARLRYAFNE